MDRSLAKSRLFSEQCCLQCCIQYPCTGTSCTAAILYLVRWTGPVPVRYRHPAGTGTGIGTGPLLVLVGPVPVRSRLIIHQPNPAITQEWMADSSRIGVRVAAPSFVFGLVDEPRRQRVQVHRMVRSTSA